MKREEITRVLETVMAGVNAKAQSEGYDTFVFDGEYVKTYNQDISISHALPIEGLSVCSVNAEDTLRVLKKMTGTDIKIELSDKGKMTISDGKTKLVLNTLLLGVEEGVNSLGIDKVKFKKVPKDFIESLGKCAFSAAKDITFGELSGVFVSGTDMMSTDNWRASWATMNGKMDTFIIPGESAKELAKFNGITTYGIDEHGAWLHLENDKGAIFSSRLLSGDYRVDDIKKYFEHDGEKKFSFPDGVQETVERIGTMANVDSVSGNPFINISFQKTKVTFTGEKVGSGYVTEELKAKAGTIPDKATVDIYNRYFMDILPKTKDFYFKDESIFIFDTGNFKHLISIRAGE